MERLTLVILKRIYIVPYWFSKICLYGSNESYTEQQRYKLLRGIVKAVNKSANVEIECKGIENLPKENGYVMFPNHQGLYDSLILIETNERPITFVMKKEVKNNILLKRIVNVMKAQVIDREDIKQSMRVIIEVAKEVREGRNFVIFPEGTRSREGNKLLEFKGGSFKSAVKVKAPIIPVAIADSYKVFDSHSLEYVKVKVSYLEPIYYEEYKDMKTIDIAKEVKKRIEKELEKIC